MTILEHVRSFVAAAAPPAAIMLNCDAEPDRPNPVDLLRTARHRLRDALEEQARLRAAHQERIAATERVRRLIASAAPAEKAAAEAVKVAAAATRDWATTGARDDQPSANEGLLNAAAEAQRKAQHAALQADGARAALREVIDAEKLARNALDSASGMVRAARAAVLVAQVQPTLAELAAMRSRYAELFADVAALSVLLDPRFGGAHPWRTHITGDGEFRRQVISFAIPLPEDRALKQRAQEWARQAARLAADPDAA
jgi:hypothetical protein